MVEENTKIAIQEEIRLGVEKQGGWYFNNFWTTLPRFRGESIGDLEKKIADKKIDVDKQPSGDMRINSIRFGWLDKRHIDRGFRRDLDSDWRYSDLYLNQTDREFFNTIDSVIEELGISDPIRLPTDVSKEEIKQHQNNVLTPIFARLREMGYNLKELCQ